MLDFNHYIDLAFLKREECSISDRITTLI